MPDRGLLNGDQRGGCKVWRTRRATSCTPDKVRRNLRHVLRPRVGVPTIRHQGEQPPAADRLFDVRALHISTELPVSLDEKLKLDKVEKNALKQSESASFVLSRYPWQPP